MDSIYPQRLDDIEQVERMISHRLLGEKRKKQRDQVITSRIQRIVERRLGRFVSAIVGTMKFVESNRDVTAGPENVVMTSATNVMNVMNDE